MPSDALSLMALTGSQFYIDDISIWTGIGDAPEMTTEIYEVLRAAYNSK
jgi:hypothetical protein